MSAAKREAAKRGLYAQFLKGRVIPSSLPVEQEVGGSSGKGKGREVVGDRTLLLSLFLDLPAEPDDRLVRSHVNRTQRNPLKLGQEAQPRRIFDIDFLDPGWLSALGSLSAHSSSE